MYDENYEPTPEELAAERELIAWCAELNLQELGRMLQEEQRARLQQMAAAAPMAGMAGAYIGAATYGLMGCKPWERR
jgi:hypothetical protein